MSISTDPRIGSELLGYRIEALIGRGGMGVVYRADDLRLKRKVALKLVVPELSEEQRFRERFLSETEIAASLEHPNVVPIYDAGEVEGQLYLAMRYVEGRDLKALLREEGPLEPAWALAICTQIAGAIDAAHAKGLVHRDVKPSNVLLDEREHVYLADFGLTRRLAEQGLPTGPGLSLGTPAYAAPEQIEGGVVDGRADVYSLGCLLYECLTGQPPFQADSELAMLWAHLQESPPVPAAYPQLAPVFAKALAKKADERYATCAELIEAAREALGIVERGRPLWSRGPVVAALGLALAAAALLAFFLNQGRGGPAKPSTKPTLTPKTDVLQEIDPKTNKLVATIRLGTDLASVAVGEGAVWVTDIRDGMLSRIDPKTGGVTAQVSAGPAAGGASYVVAGQDSVWVSNTGGGGAGGGALTRFDPGTLTNIGSFALTPGSETFNCGPVTAGEGGIWVYASGAIYRVTADNLVARVAGTPFCSGDLAAGAGAVWVTNAYYAAELLRVDPAALRIVDRIRLGFYPRAIAAERHGVWIADGRNDAIARISPSTNRIVARVTVGHRPTALAAGEGSLWVANLDDGTVSRLDPKRGKVVATINVGPNPTHLAAGEGGVWITVHPE